MCGSNLSRAIRETKGKIHVLECIESAGVIMEDDSITLQCLYNKMEALNRQQHSYWWNKSKSAWIEDGDRNTKYFHSLVRHRKTRNWIHFNVDNEGNHVANQKDISNCFIKWYDHLWNYNDLGRDGDWSLCPMPN